MILVAVLGFVIFKSVGNKEIANGDLTPIEGTTEDTAATPTPSSTPISTPKVIVRTGVSIEVQNGAGITGDASIFAKSTKNFGLHRC